MLDTTDIYPGDVLLCRGTPGATPAAAVRSRITAVTGSPYTHAAIALSSSEIFDSRTRHGVTVRSMTDLLREQVHVAVLRHPDAWDAVRIQGLQDYAASLQALGAGYNYREALKYASKRRTHDVDVMDKLSRYFDEGEVVKPATDFGPFFCSQLVVACFVDSGYLSPSASIVIDPSVYAPGDLAQEPAFGYLVGFVAADPKTEVPIDDPLLTLAKYDEVINAR